MNTEALWDHFYASEMGTGRITGWHVSLFAALCYCYLQAGCHQPFSVSRRRLMALSHIRSLHTYHRLMKELVTLGHIAYLPTYHPKIGSLVAFNIPAAGPADLFTSGLRLSGGKPLKHLYR